MEHLRGGLSAGFEAGVGRTTIVLSNQQGTANGYVGFFPRRSEWFHVPPAESLLGSLEWYSLLATHEGRHVAQLAEERRGSVLAAYVLLGELGEAALLLGLGAPSWFLEGDAVLTETLATESGRGRHPGFQRPLRAAALEDDLPTWRQAVFGSYRRGFVNPYELGYLLTARIRRDFGPQAAGEILRGAGRWAAVPGAFERNVRRVTGLSTAELYRTTLAELEESWRAQGEGVPLTPVRPLLADTGGALRDAAEYRYPAGVRGGTVALKASLSQEPALVLIDGEGRERVLRPALAPVGMSAREDRVVWAQLFPDPRWGNRTRTDLVELRLSTGEVRRLTRGRVMQSPRRRRGRRQGGRGGGAPAAGLAAGRVRAGRRGGGGPPRGGRRPPAGARLVPGRAAAVRLRDLRGGQGAAGADPAGARAGRRGGPARGGLGGPPAAAPGAGEPGRPGRLGRLGPVRLRPRRADERLRPGPGTGEVRQVTSRPYGIEGPAVSGDELLFSDGVARGLQPVAMALRPEEWRPAEARPAEARPGRRVDVFRPIVEREGLEPLLDARQVPRRSYEVRPYRPAAEEILPYAWLPVV